MTWPVVLALLAGVAVGALAVRRLGGRLRRADFIRTYTFSRNSLDALRKRHPALSDRDVFLVARALRQFFLVHVRTAPATIGMPSRVVDDLWHEFILDTRAYHDFCARAFGGYFHHVPAARMRPGVSTDAGLRLAWRHACLEENIDPRKPTRLPLLFAIDAKLGIAGGNTYSLKPIGREPSSSASDGAGGGCGGFACAGGLACGDGSAGGDGGGGCGGGGGGGGD